MNKDYQIEAMAEEVIKRHGFDAFPICPIKIAEAENIYVNPKPANLGAASGHLLRIGDDFHILFSQEIDHVGYQKFSIAHELGHYFLDGHMDKIFENSDKHESRANFRSADPFEIEADKFAAALLMPQNIFWNEARKHNEGMDVILKIQPLSGASLTATARRFAITSKEPVGVVFSTNGIVDYCEMSPSFKTLPNMTWLRKGMSIPNTITRDSQNIAVQQVESDNSTMEDWFNGEASYELLEEVMALGKTGQLMTVLTISDMPDEDEEDEYVEDTYSRYSRF